MKLIKLVATLVAAGLLVSASWAGVPTAHLISYQGQALDDADEPLVTGDLAVRIYDAETDGTEVYYSGADFNGAIADGIFNVVLGSVTPLMLDNQLLYYLEVDIDGEEVIGDASTGRQPFYPGGGSHDLTYLEDRIQALEDLENYTCDPGWLDLNGYDWDQCEFQIDNGGIYVATPDNGGSDFPECGDPLNPCATISFGLGQALSTPGKVRIHVMNGYYRESVSLADGIDLLGGYGIYWNRDVAATSTIVEGNTITGHKKTLVASGLGVGCTVEGFIIRGESTTEIGGNTYAVYVDNCNGLSLLNNQIQGGQAGPGQDGGSGMSGPTGSGGEPGLNSNLMAGSPCSGDFAGGAGGSSPCGSVGGNGGGVSCPPQPDTQSSASDGENGGGPGGGMGGDGGMDGRFDGTTCYLPGAPLDGMPGVSGIHGTHGGGGNGGSSGEGGVMGGEWLGYPGDAGTVGSHGSGGGGGGAGGGSRAYLTYPDDQLGATGGGGGAGGCGGEGGEGGMAGGGSFGLFVFGGIAPDLVDNHFLIGIGGRGGNGGAGGTGSAGGTGGAGGESEMVAFCTGNAGDGGEGGDGGSGGGGGGGCGGAAFGIYLSGVTDPGNYLINNILVGGQGGSGGSGGVSMGVAGTDGAMGTHGALYQ